MSLLKYGFVCIIIFIVLLLLSLLLLLCYCFKSTVLFICVSVIMHSSVSNGDNDSV